MLSLNLYIGMYTPHSGPSTVSDVNLPYKPYIALNTNQRSDQSFFTLSLPLETVKLVLAR